MSGTGFSVIYVLVMIAVIVGVDFAFLRNNTKLRLIVNICIVVAFGLVYLLLRSRS